MQQCLMFIYTGTIEQEYLQLEVILLHWFPSNLSISFAQLTAQVAKKAVII